MLGRIISTTAPLVTKQGSRGMATVATRLKDITTRLGELDYKTMGKFALKELGPPKPSEIPAAIRDGLKLTKGNWRNVTVREAWLNALVTTEVLCWFFVGECIGKGSLIGYQV